MTDIPFYATVMGRRFYEATMPALVEAIDRLNASLERLAATGVLNASTAPATMPAPPNPALGGSE